MANTPQALMVDAGHGLGVLGSADNGASGVLNGVAYSERTYVVGLARKVYAILRAAPELKDTSIFGVGIETRMSCSQKVQYMKNIITERKYQPFKCIALSLHANAGGGHGSEIWTPTKQTGDIMDLAGKMVKSFTEYADFPPRSPAIKPSKWDRFGHLYIDDVPCNWILVESFFIDDKLELAHALTNQDRLAETIAHGILTYIRS